MSIRSLLLDQLVLIRIVAVDRVVPLLLGRNAQLLVRSLELLELKLLRFSLFEHFVEDVGHVRSILAV